MKQETSLILHASLIRQDLNPLGCRDAKHCAWAEALKRLLKTHGYVHVDALGFSITRDGQTHREHAPMTKKILAWIVEYDRCQGNQEELDKLPLISATLRFSPTTRIVKSTPERREQINAARRRREADRKAEGLSRKVYTTRERIIGFAGTK